MAEGPHILPALPKVAQSAKHHQPRGGGAGAAPYEPVCAIFRRYLHGEKLKFTPERAMMLDAVLRKEGLFEPEQLVSDLKQLGHEVSRATVYRTLAHLQDAGILKQVFFDNKQSYYEVIAGRQTHDYLICVATGRVIEFSSEKLRKLRDEICREHGFDPVSHQFHIFGLSPEAKAEGKQADARHMSGFRPSASAPAAGLSKEQQKSPGSGSRS
jgi:Fur family ferric uptake transcriptional regulator